MDEEILRRWGKVDGSGGSVQKIVILSYVELWCGGVNRNTEEKMNNNL